MTDTTFPLIIEPEELESRLGTENLVVVDLCKPETYASGHIPGAVHINYASIVRADKPVMGLLPEPSALAGILSLSGISPDSQVVSYDDEGGGRAARLLWTLAAAGHTRMSLLNGGLHAWANERHPLDNASVHPARSEYPVTYQQEPVADADYILAHLENSGLQLLDTRSADEFNGVKKLANKAGHIPGAKHMEWTQAIDMQNNARLKSTDELQEMLTGLGFSKEKETVVYCQSHHRSAHTYIVLRSLGFNKLKGYHGAWSEWGNRTDTPVE